MKLRVAGAVALIVAAKLSRGRRPVPLQARRRCPFRPGRRGGAGRADPRLWIRSGRRAAGGGGAQACLHPRGPARDPADRARSCSATSTRCRCAFISTARPAGFRGVIERGTRASSSCSNWSLFNIVPTMLELAWSRRSCGASTAPASPRRWPGPSLCLCRLHASPSPAGRSALRREMNAARHRGQRSRRSTACSITRRSNISAPRRTRRAATTQAQARLREAAIGTASRSSALFAIGQAAIIAVGLILVMVMAGRGVAAGAMTVGDFVLVNAYLLQLYAPLEHARHGLPRHQQSLTDVEAMVALLRRAARDRGPAGRAGAGRGPRPRRVRRRSRFAYDPRRPILERSVLRGAAGKHGGGGRAERRRQVDSRPPAVPLLRRPRRRASRSTARMCAT